MRTRCSRASICSRTSVSVARATKRATPKNGRCPRSSLGTRCTRTGLIALVLGFAIFWEATRGSWLNYGVDFTGGTLVQVQFHYVMHFVPYLILAASVALGTWPNLALSASTMWIVVSCAWRRAHMAGARMYGWRVASTIAATVDALLADGGVRRARCRPRGRRGSRSAPTVAHRTRAARHA